MSGLEVRIITLEPMRVASVHAFGASPEEKAFSKLIAWARPRGLTEDPKTHRVFGFNNPDLIEQCGNGSAYVGQVGKRV